MEWKRTGAGQEKQESKRYKGVNREAKSGGCNEMAGNLDVV